MCELQGINGYIDVAILNHMPKDFMTEFRERLCRLERIIGDMDEIIAQ
jgi:hypothetical protein